MPANAKTEAARRAGARALELAGAAAIEASRRLTTQGGVPSLQGDRWIEWSFCFARLTAGPGSTLDFGAGIGFLSLAAAQKGHDVIALDRLPSTLDYVDERVTPIEADILDRPLADRRFDQILNCSSVEHVGLAGRYGSSLDPNGDLLAMAILRDLLAPAGNMILTIPVGRDLVCAPLHRIYGEDRLPRLLEGYVPDEEQYWRKEAAAWKPTSRSIALETEGSNSFYSLGLFVLRAES
jgi:SAM-dependent methyltransferase